MKTGKAAESVLKRSVIETVNRQKFSSRTSRAGIGQDAGRILPAAGKSETAGQNLLPAGKNETAGQNLLLAGKDEAVGQNLPVAEKNGQIAMVSSTMLTGEETGIPELAVMRACNSLSAAGARPYAVTVQIALPETYGEADLKRTVRQITAACETAGVVLANGHTLNSEGVKQRVISVSAFGMAEGRMPAQAARAKVTDSFSSFAAGSAGEDISEQEYSLQLGMQQGVLPEPAEYELIMTKHAGLAGAALLAAAYREELHERYHYSLIDRAADTISQLSVQAEAELAQKFGVTQMHDIAEGGVFGAVWELCERLGMGAELELKKIPIRQDTIEICEFFDINPYQLRGDGALLIAAKRGAALLSAFAESGIPASVIGRLLPGNDRIVKNSYEEVRYLEPNRFDEYDNLRMPRRRE